MAEPRLDDKIAIEAVGGPTFNNVTIQSENGWRNTIEGWDRDLRIWRLQFVARWKHTDPSDESVTRFRQLLAFFRSRRGSSRPFRMRDWTDYTDGGAGYIVTHNGVRRLVKRYDDGFDGDPYDLPIYKPVSGTITQSGGTAGTIDYTNGIVTGGTATRWTGEYDMWVHFVEDKMEYRADPSGLIQWQGLTVMEDVLDEDT